MTTAFKHLQSNEMPPTAKPLVCFAIAPPMQAIIVYSELIVDP
jgi:hypothetical protein